MSMIKRGTCMQKVTVSESLYTCPKCGRRDVSPGDCPKCGETLTLTAGTTAKPKRKAVKRSDE